MAKTKQIFRTTKQQRTTKILSGLVIGGSIVGMTAVLLSAPFDSATSAETMKTKPVAWRQNFEPVVPAKVAEVEAPAPIAIEEATTIVAEQPVVAIPHEEPGIDFEKQAENMMIEGDLRGAFTQLRKHVFTNAPTAEVLHHIGTLGRTLGEYGVAEQALMDAAALDTGRADVQIELARVRLDGRDDLDGARIAAREAIRIDPRDAMAWNVAGRVAMAESEFHRAAQAFDESLDLDPTNAIVHNNAGLNYLYMKRGADAVDALETAVSLYDDDAPHFVFNNLGLAHELVENFEEAREAFEEALLQNPFYSRAKLNLDRVEKLIAALEAENAFETARGVTLDDEPADEDIEYSEDEILAEDT